MGRSTDKGKKPPPRCDSCGYTGSELQTVEADRVEVQVCRDAGLCLNRARNAGTYLLPAAS